MPMPVPYACTLYNQRDCVLLLLLPFSFYFYLVFLLFFRLQFAVDGMQVFFVEFTRDKRLIFCLHEALGLHFVIAFLCCVCPLWWTSTSIFGYEALLIGGYCTGCKVPHTERRWDQSVKWEQCATPISSLLFISFLWRFVPPCTMRMRRYTCAYDQRTYAHEIMRWTEATASTSFLHEVECYFSQMDST